MSWFIVLLLCTLNILKLIGENEFALCTKTLLLMHPKNLLSSLHTVLSLPQSHTKFLQNLAEVTSVNHRTSLLCENTNKENNTFLDLICTTHTYIARSTHPSPQFGGLQVEPFFSCLELFLLFPYYQPFKIKGKGMRIRELLLSLEGTEVVWAHFLPETFWIQK